MNHVVQYAGACVYHILVQTQTVHVVRHTSNALSLELTAEDGLESRDSEACTSSSIACVDLITNEGLGVWLFVETRDSSLIGTGTQDAATLWFARRVAANEHDTSHLWASACTACRGDEFPELLKGGLLEGWSSCMHKADAMHVSSAAD